MSDDQFGGGKMQQSANERAMARTVETAGELWAVPWTGVDASRKFVCPGFEFDPGSGLWCWAMPLPVVQHWGMRPGIIGTFARAYDKKSSDPTDPNAAQIKHYMQLINTHLKRIKIAGPETIQTFLPSNEEYYIACQGPWARTKSGVLIARRDPTGSRFLKTGGVPQDSFANQVNASRIASNNLPSPPAGDSGAPVDNVPIVGDPDGEVAQGQTDAPDSLPVAGSAGSSGDPITTGPGRIIVHPPVQDTASSLTRSATVNQAVAKAESSIGARGVVGVPVQGVGIHFTRILCESIRVETGEGPGGLTSPMDADAANDRILNQDRSRQERIQGRQEGVIISDPGESER